MISEDMLLQNRARQRHSRERFWSSFDDSGFESLATLAAGLSHFGGEAQGGIQRALEGQVHRVHPGGMAAGGACSLLYQQTYQVVGDGIHGDHFHRVGCKNSTALHALFLYASF